MSLTLVRRWVGAAALSMSFACSAATSVLAEEPAPPSAAGQGGAAPAEQDKAEPTGQGSAAPAEQDKAAPTGQGSAAPAEQDKAAPTGQGSAAPTAPEKPAVANVAEQQLPSPQVQEALIKSTLLSLNDATKTGDWNVFHTTLSEPLRKVVNPEKLKQSFGHVLASFRDFSVVAGMSVSPQIALINNGNLLVMQGVVDLQNLGSIKYDLKYISTDTGWELIGANFDSHSSLRVPDSVEQEALVKSTLSTINDANISGNYSVLYNKMSVNFRDQNSIEKLREFFKPYINVNVVAALAKPIEIRKDAKNNVLKLEGNIRLSEKSVLGFDFQYEMSEGEWKPLGINVGFDLHPASDGWAK